MNSFLYCLGTYQIIVKLVNIVSNKERGFGVLFFKLIFGVLTPTTMSNCCFALFFNFVSLPLLFQFCCAVRHGI